MLRLQDIPPLLDMLDEKRKNNPEHITFTYQKLFNSPEGQLILIDLLDRFYEFKKPDNMEQVGSQAVITYLKNTIMGNIDTTWFEPKGEQHAEQH